MSEERIRQWDLSAVMRYMVERQTLSLRLLYGAAREYRRFLVICLDLDTPNPALLAPPVDRVWQVHILHADNYAQMCGTVFGRPLVRTNAPADHVHRSTYTEQTLRAYQARYGVPDPTFWPHVIDRAA